MCFRLDDVLPLVNVFILPWWRWYWSLLLFVVSMARVIHQYGNGLTCSLVSRFRLLVIILCLVESRWKFREACFGTLLIKKFVLFVFFCCDFWNKSTVVIKTLQVLGWSAFLITVHPARSNGAKIVGTRLAEPNCSAEPKNVWDRYQKYVEPGTKTVEPVPNYVGP